MPNSTSPERGSRRSVWRSTRSQSCSPARSAAIALRSARCSGGRNSCGVSTRLQLTRQTGRATCRLAKNRSTVAARRLAEAGHRLVNRRERPAELVGEPPMRRKAQDRRHQPIGGPAALHQAEILLHQPAGQLERCITPRRELEALAGDQIGELAIGASIVLREAVPAGGRAAAPAPRPGPAALSGSAPKHLAAALIEQLAAPLGELVGEALVDLDPLRADRAPSAPWRGATGRRETGGNAWPQSFAPPARASSRARGDDAG